jgi:Flp pilus assembly protein TadB
LDGADHAAVTGGEERTVIALAGLAVVAVIGLVLLTRGLFPPRPPLADVLRAAADRRARTATDSTSTFRGRLAVGVLRRLHGESREQMAADLEVTDLDIETYAIDKLNAAFGGAVIAVVFAYWRGMIDGALVAGFFALAGLATGYLLPDLELKRKAAARRQEFSEALTAFISLVAVCVSGGGGLNTAMKDAAQVGSSWCFRHLDDALNEAALLGEPAWNSLERLGRRLDIPPLIELAGALGLAGTSGTRVNETMQARAESSRARETADAMAEAEERSEKMNLPIGLMLFGWMVILGYPAVQGLTGS